MSVVIFSCKKCGSSLEVDSDLSGTLIDCPQCKEPLDVPFGKTPIKPKVITPNPVKNHPPAPPPPTKPAKPWSEYGIYSFRGAFVAVGNIMFAIVLWALIYQMLFGLLNVVLQGRFAFWRIFT